eukprot:g1144.t1
MASKKNDQGEGHVDQNERAFMKQSNIFVGAKSKVLVKRKGKKKRFFKDIGLGFKTPAAAINGSYIDKKCPFTGNVSIRGRVLKGICISTKMNKTVIVRRDYLRYVKKYRRFEKRHKNIAAHVSPCFEVKEGDILTIGQCRPLSKTVRFNVLKVESQKVVGNVRKTFRMF